MVTTPAESSYMEGYKEGLNVGVFIAYCQSYHGHVTTKTLDLQVYDIRILQRTG